jgi:hypothetical protein
MTITRRSLADEIDRLDDQLAEIQTDKAEIFKAYRAQLEKDGIAKPEITVEVTSVKAAIRRRRAMADDPLAVENKDALTDAIYAEISGPAQRGTGNATRARAQRAKARTSESMADTAELAREMAAEGMISEQAAEETVRIAEGVAKKFGNGSGEGGAPPVGGSTPPQTTPAPAAAAKAGDLELGSPQPPPAPAQQGSGPPPVIWRAPSLIEVDELDIPPQLRRGHPDAWVQLRSARASP